MAVPRSHHLFKSSSRPISFLWIGNIPRFPPACMGRKTRHQHSTLRPLQAHSSLLSSATSSSPEVPALQCATQCPGNFSCFCPVWWTVIFLEDSRQTSECPDHPRQVNCKLSGQAGHEDAAYATALHVVSGSLRPPPQNTSEQLRHSTPVSPRSFPSLVPDLEPPCRCYSGGMNRERKACMFLFTNILKIGLLN